LPRSRDVPSVARLVFCESDTHNRLDTLESVFPRHHNAQWRTILIWQRLTVHSETQQREWMHGFVHAQPFDVGPFEHIPPLSGHLIGIVNRGEFNKLGFAQWVCALDQFAKRKTNPRHDDRPSLHTSMAINAFLGSGKFQNRVEIPLLLFRYGAINS